MSDMMSQIADDIEDYERGCKTLGVEVHYKPCGSRGPTPDCYGEHAEWVAAKLSGVNYPEPR